MVFFRGGNAMRGFQFVNHFFKSNSRFSGSFVSRIFILLKVQYWNLTEDSKNSFNSILVEWEENGYENIFKLTVEKKIRKFRLHLQGRKEKKRKLTLISRWIIKIYVTQMMKTREEKKLFRSALYKFVRK